MEGQQYSNSIFSADSPMTQSIPLQRDLLTDMFYGGNNSGSGSNGTTKNIGRQFKNNDAEESNAALLSGRVFLNNFSNGDGCDSSISHSRLYECPSKMPSFQENMFSVREALVPSFKQQASLPNLIINRQQSSANHQQLDAFAQSKLNNFQASQPYINDNDCDDEPFKNITNAQNNRQNYHPLTTGRKTQQIKHALGRMTSGVKQQDNQGFSRKLFSPQGSCKDSILQSSQISLAGAVCRGPKSSEKLMDRFIPYRLGENLQAKFEAVSQKYDEEIQYNMDFRASQLVQELGLNLDQPGQASQAVNDGQGLDVSINGIPNLSHTTSVNSTAAVNGSGLNATRSRGFSNIFGGISTLEQVNGFALSRQSSINNSSNNPNANISSGGSNPASSSTGGPIYPTIPNTSERDLQANIQNYNNLLEQQIFEEEEPRQDLQTDETRNLSLAAVGGLSRGASGFQLKENRSEHSNQTQSKPITSGALGGKIFKFKKNTQARDSALLGDASSSVKNPFTTNFLNLEGDHNSHFSTLNPFAPRGRKIPERPYKVLDAPALSDDFYLNLVDWSQQNMLAVALGQSVYVWNAFDSSVSELCQLEGIDNQVTSVAWSQRGSHLCVGNKHGEIAIWDINQQKEIRTLSGHSNRVGACSWNGSLIATGSRDRSILVRDVRAQESYQQRLLGHKQEVCGLKWSMHDENQIASGGNDNKLFIWQPMSNGDQPLAKFSQHQAAVKAIGWSPQQRGLLATGGGTADQCIRFWNTLTLQHINSINTGSQVCNLMFSRTTDEIVSTHGYSLNQIIVWKYPSMEKISTLTGHTFRVLYLAMSPDGASIVTGAGDETLRFWNVFPKCKSSKGVVSSLSGGDHGIGNVIGTGNSTLFPSSIDFR